MRRKLEKLLYLIPSQKNVSITLSISQSITKPTLYVAIKVLKKLVTEGQTNFNKQVFFARMKKRQKKGSLPLEVYVQILSL